MSQYPDNTIGFNLGKKTSLCDRLNRPEINRDWLPLSVADERLQTSWGCEKQTKSTMRNETGVLSTTIPSLLVMEAKE